LIIKHKDNDSWKELYPKTLAGNVKLEDGRSLEAYKEDVDSRFPDNLALWEGSRYPTADQTTTPTKKLSECANGWLLRWQGYTTGEGLTTNFYQYSYIPKIHSRHDPGRPIRFVLAQTNGMTVYKYVFTHDDRLIGHDTNGDGDNSNIALSGIFEW